MENISIEEKDRLAKLQHFIDEGINPYPARTDRTHTCQEAREAKIDTKVIIVGRIMSKRIMGKLCFCHIKDDSNQIQVAFSEKELGKDNYKEFTKFFDLGDFVEVKGDIFTTHKGEISVLAKEYKILSKSILPMPEK